MRPPDGRTLRVCSGVALGPGRVPSSTPSHVGVRIMMWRTLQLYVVRSSTRPCPATRELPRRARYRLIISSFLLLLPEGLWYLWSANCCMGSSSSHTS